VREDGRTVGGEGWQGKYITERNGRSSWERQGTAHDNGMNEWNYLHITLTMQDLPIQ
jgi:hypothetical protein